MASEGSGDALLGAMSWRILLCVPCALVGAWELYSGRAIHIYYPGSSNFLIRMVFGQVFVEEGVLARLDGAFWLGLAVLAIFLELFPWTAPRGNDGLDPEL